MARYYGKTKERGYGWDHAKLREQWKPRVQTGQVACHAVICLEVMDGRSRLIAPGAPWHLGHTEDRASWTGPEHQRCGAADGARRGNQQQPRSLALLRPGNPVCEGCGQPYHYAARSCEMCGVHYHPSYGQQRTCSRACGVALKRRVRGYAGKAPPAPKPACEICGQPCANGYRYCSYLCAGQGRSIHRQTWPSSPIQHYTCRYCGKPGVAHGTGLRRREVCPARECQLARLMANNLRVRNGLTKDEADAQMAAIVTTGRPPAYEQWRSSRLW